MKGSVSKRDNRWVVQYWDHSTKKKIYRRFQAEDDAKLFWAHLNVSRAEGKLDARDYAKGPGNSCRLKSGT